MNAYIRHETFRNFHPLHSLGTCVLKIHWNQIFVLTSNMNGIVEIVEKNRHRIRTEMAHGYEEQTFGIFIMLTYFCVLKYIGYLYIHCIYECIGNKFNECNTHTKQR